jgi:hypothetical protein
MTEKTPVIDSILQPRHQDGFSRDLWGDEFAHCLARITLGWGALEARLFWILYAIDFKRAPRWVSIFFKPRTLAQKKDILRTQILASMKTSHPAYIAKLEKQFSDLQSIQHRRNTLVHGFWLPSQSDRSFKVQPLSLVDGTLNLAEAIEIDHSFLITLIQDMRAFTSRTAMLGAEMMAHQQLKKRNPNYVSTG